jgi:hypothetical protein
MMAAGKAYMQLDGDERIFETDVNMDTLNPISRSWMRDLMSAINIKEFVVHGNPVNNPSTIALFSGSHRARGGWEDFLSFHENLDKAKEEYDIAYSVDPKAFVWAEAVDVTSGMVLWKIMRSQDA